MLYRVTNYEDIDFLFNTREEAEDYMFSRPFVGDVFIEELESYEEYQYSNLW